MATVWPVYEGEMPTTWPWARLPLSEAVSLFELRSSDFIGGPDTAVRFGARGVNLTYAGYKHIVVEIEGSEARQSEWKAGFYKSKVKPRDAFGRLIQEAFVSKLGKDNVVRLDWEPAMDSQGREALKITVVIPPGTAQKLDGRTVLDASVKLRERLQEMRVESTPIVEYATEAELAQDAGR